MRIRRRRASISAELNDGRSCTLMVWALDVENALKEIRNLLIRSQAINCHESNYMCGLALFHVKARRVGVGSYYPVISIILG